MLPGLTCPIRSAFLAGSYAPAPSHEWWPCHDHDDWLWPEHFVFLARCYVRKSQKIMTHPRSVIRISGVSSPTSSLAPEQHWRWPASDEEIVFGHNHQTDSTTIGCHPPPNRYSKRRRNREAVRLSQKKDSTPSISQAYFGCYDHKIICFSCRKKRTVEFSWRERMNHDRLSVSFQIICGNI